MDTFIKTLSVYINAGHLPLKARETEKCAVMAQHAAFCHTMFNRFSVRGARKSHAELNSDHTTSCGVFRGCPGMRNAVREPARVQSTPTPASEAARDYLTQ